MVPTMVQRGRKSAAQLAVIPLKQSAYGSRPEFKSPPPPEHLGAPERLIWADACRDLNLSPTALSVLATGLEAHMRARQCRQQIEAEGMTHMGRDRQVKVHPLLAVERDARAAWLSRRSRHALAGMVCCGMKPSDDERRQRFYALVQRYNQLGCLLPEPDDLDAAGLEKVDQVRMILIEMAKVKKQIDEMLSEATAA
jgi:hypothetical protein